MTTYTVGGLSCGMSYTLGVDAYDAAGNRSAIATVTAPTAACPDTSPPTTPVLLTTTGTTSTSISVAWSPSFDNVVVAGYGIYRAGTRVGTTTATGYTVSGLSCGVSYSIGVDAYDAAGNRSQQATLTSSTTTCQTLTPPPQGGYFSLQPVGAWSTLPSGGACVPMVHRSPWEPRPDNYKRNHIVPDPQSVHDSFAARPLAGGGSYDSRWDSWLLPRVDGQFTGTTDEIFQWAACKWGIPDNVIRAVANQESTWYQYLAYPSNRCVSYYGCGDFFGGSSAASTVYCNAIARYGYDYQRDYGAGLCPQTFSILGIKSWQAPGWGQMPDNQNGTFPFNRNSTAFAADYYAGHLRGCLEGWIFWLDDVNPAYGPGDLWGCVGKWFSGDWHSAAADQYASEVQGHYNNRIWLQPGFSSDKPGCHPTYGCPVSDSM